jgi:hypothetical protein
MTDEPSGRSGEPHCDDAERLLAGIHFHPRASLGPEIVGRARRGEAAVGDFRPRRVLALRPMLGLAAALILITGSAFLVQRSSSPVILIDSCCQNLDGGARADDGFVLEANGRHIYQLRLYEDRDSSGTFTPADTVRFVRGAEPSLASGGDARTTRVCCSDLDGEGKPDDGMLILSRADESVVLAAVYEQQADGGGVHLR